MKHKNFKIERTKKGKILMMIFFSIIILLFLISVSAANDKFDNVTSSTSNRSNINKNAIKENYFPDTKSFDVLNTNPQEIAENIENISKKYNIDVSNISENIVEENNDGINKEIIIQLSDEEKILCNCLEGRLEVNYGQR